MKNSLSSFKLFFEEVDPPKYMRFINRVRAVRKPKKAPIRAIMISQLQYTGITAKR